MNDASAAPAPDPARDTVPAQVPVLDLIATDRVIAVVRAPEIPDPAKLCAALAAGGIRAVEFTFTIPGLPDVIRAAEAARKDGVRLGAGTVLKAQQAEAAIDAGAEYLVTPTVTAEVAAAASRRGVPVMMGAFTPTEVLQAIDLGAAAVKLFPATVLGPRYVKDLLAPFPGARLVPSGGVNADNARGYLDNGAFAVCCGTEVVPPKLVLEGAYTEITARAARFVAALG